MGKVINSPEALADIREVATWFAQDNPRAAERVVDELDAAIAQLANFPLLVQAVDDIAPGVRRISVRPHVIYYRVRDDEVSVDVLRVVHGARDLGSIFP